MWSSSFSCEIAYLSEKSFLALKKLHHCTSLMLEDIFCCCPFGNKHRFLFAHEIKIATAHITDYSRRFDTMFFVHHFASALLHLISLINFTSNWGLFIYNYAWEKHINEQKRFYFHFLIFSTFQDYDKLHKLAYTLYILTLGTAHSNLRECQNLWCY